MALSKLALRTYSHLTVYASGLYFCNHHGLGREGGLADIIFLIFVFEFMCWRYDERL